MKSCLISAVVLFCFALLCGCSTETYHYQISVTNNSSEPITVWPVKDGGPYEPQWTSPEQYMQRPEAAENQVPGLAISIAPGKTADTRVMPAKLDASSRMLLRVYLGQVDKLSELLAIGKRTTMRTEAMLLPGRNVFVVDSKTGAVHITRNEESSLAPTTR